MFLSVIIPVYNAVKYLDDCVQSILMQTETDYEIILVNDGSTDGSAELCDSYSDHDQIRVIHKENSGALLTRRIGMKAAVGEYLYCMDADDYLISKEAFAILKKAIDETDCDMIFFEATRDTEQLVPWRNYPFNNYQLFRGKEKEKLYIIMLDNSFNTLWNKVFNRATVDFEESYDELGSKIVAGNDGYQLLPIITAVNSVLYINDVLYYYRPAQNSISHSFSFNLYDSLKAFRLRVEEYAQKWQLENAECALQRERIILVLMVLTRMRYCSKEKWMSDLPEFLLSIAKDDFFMEVYKKGYMRNIGRLNRISLYLLFHKKVKLLVLFNNYFVPIWFKIRRFSFR